MFIGHMSVGFAAKKFAPRTSLALLLAAPMLSDLLWPIFLGLGWEHVRIVPGFTRYNAFDLYDYPWSHSLLLCFLWGALFAGIYYAFSRYRKGAIAIWIGVVSHWILDWVTHTPDMPLYPGAGPKLGLGLWNHVAATMTVEIAMLLVGVFLYATAIHSRDRIGKIGFVTYAVVLLAMFIGDRFGSEPPSLRALVITSLVLEAVLLAWPAWFDRRLFPKSDPAQ
jgi:membrane-bound metal-dependent hydrolase YbcI (DUF457 family)